MEEIISTGSDVIFIVQTLDLSGYKMCIQHALDLQSIFHHVANEIHFNAQQLLL